MVPKESVNADLVHKCVKVEHGESVEGKSPHPMNAATEKTTTAMDRSTKTAHAPKGPSALVIQALKVR